MQGQCRHEKEEYEHDAQLEEKHQDRSSNFLFVNLEQLRRPGDAGVPKQIRGDEIEQRKYKADDEGAEEKVPEEDDFLAFHSVIIYFSEARSIIKATASCFAELLSHTPRLRRAKQAVKQSWPFC
jgi:hypothetical protein